MVERREHDPEGVHEEAANEEGPTEDMEEAVAERRKARREAHEAELKAEIEHEDVERQKKAEEVANPNNERGDEPWD